MKIVEFFEGLSERIADVLRLKAVKPGSKDEFLAKLRKGLSALPKTDMEEQVAFYSEMIDDRIEEGLSEEEAVKAAGPVEDIISQILENNPNCKKDKAGAEKEHSLRGWAVVLLVLGSPVWFSLLIAAAAVVFSVWISVWAVIISLWAAAAALAVCLPGLVIAAMIWSGVFAPVRLMAIGAGLACAGLAIFMFLISKALTKGWAIATVKLGRGVRAIFVGRDRVK